MRNYYKVLEISENASPKEIKKAYYKLIKQWHPDHNPHTPISDDMMKMFNEAYDVLSDPQKRQAHDESIRIRPPDIDQRKYSYETEDSENMPSDTTWNVQDLKVYQGNVTESVALLFLNKIVAIIFIPIGALFFIYYAYSIYEVKSAYAWPTTTGHIFSLDRVGNSFLTVIYQYTVKGKTYTNKETVRRGYLAEYKKKDVIPVYYEPDDPENSILDIDTAVKKTSIYVDLAPLGFGLISFTVGMLCLIQILYYKYKKKIASYFN